MSPSQFVAPDDDATEKRNEAAAVQNVSAEQFAQLLASTEKHYGKPTKLFDLHVFSMDPTALSGKGTSTEDKLDSMFAIGMIARNHSNLNPQGELAQQATGGVELGTTCRGSESSTNHRGATQNRSGVQALLEPENGPSPGNGWVEGRLF